MGSKNIAVRNNNIKPLWMALVTFLILIPDKNSAIQYLNIVLSSLCLIVIVIIYCNRHHRFLIRKVSTILPWTILEVGIFEWAVWMNARNAWFTSWGWALAILLLSMPILFTRDFKDICTKNGKTATLLAFLWLTSWTLLHFFNDPVGSSQTMSICWYSFTALTFIIIACAYFKHMSGLFLPLIMFLNLMDAFYYQIYPWLEFGVPVLLTIPWIN